MTSVHRCSNLFDAQIRYLPAHQKYVAICIKKDYCSITSTKTNYIIVKLQIYISNSAKFDLKGRFNKRAASVKRASV